METIAKEEYPKSRKVRRADGTVMYLWGKQLHNWDGPALVDVEKKLVEYYIYGIKFTKDKWLEAKKDQVGLPFYKSSSSKIIDGTRY